MLQGLATGFNHEPVSNIVQSGAILPVWRRRWQRFNIMYLSITSFHLRIKLIDKTVLGLYLRQDVIYSLVLTELKPFMLLKHTNVYSVLHYVIGLTDLIYKQ